MASHVVDWRQQPPASCRYGALAIGNFDGAHRGHGALIQELSRMARSLGGPAVCLTFDPHPLALLRPDRALPLLTTPSDRATYLHHLGADQVLTLRATHSLLELSAAEFFESVVIDRLQARALVEGPNFGFGRAREGTIETLAELCRQSGRSLTIVPPVLMDGVEISSSRIRADLARGDVAAAARLLGRPYRIHGIVGEGQHRGRQIGFPTANLQGVATVLPADGVYAVNVTTEQGEFWPGAANVGGNPTFAESERKIEVHLIGFSGDLYGSEATVAFIARLRDTRGFSGVDELTEQLRIDVATATRLLQDPLEEEPP